MTALDQYKYLLIKSVSSRNADKRKVCVIWKTNLDSWGAKQSDGQYYSSLLTVYDDGEVIESKPNSRHNLPPVLLSIADAIAHDKRIAHASEFYFTME